MINNDPKTAPWGYCDRDLPRAALVSPYKFKTAQAHYEALLAETKSRGGPMQHTYATVPGDWNGRYGVEFRNGDWYASMAYNQIPTILSLLTPEYQQAHGAADVPRGGQRRLAMAFAVLLAGRVHAPLRSGGDAGADQSVHLPDHAARWCRSPPAWRATSSPTSTSAASSAWTATCRAWAPTCRAGTARPSVSGTRTR